ncbi:MAG: LysM peptidoglycan-binding domain-containing protein [Oscillospiraceae bacterium]|nr:LysM peptidoglycan-binding domain-containing protein [Oscillospiraceae bacterium]
MELQFDKSTCKSLHKVLSHVLDQELTQEIRLPESLPDIGRVLGSWGQVILRSKEWYGGSAGVSGGVMAWVLYAPEDGTAAKSVEAWIPFQMKWDIPESQRDGVICAIPLIKSIDARSVSARKIMLRTIVSVQGQAYEPRETAFYQANQLPDDIQVLKQTYQLEMPVEAGEKPLQIEDELQISLDAPNAGNMWYYDLKPEVTESRILGDKLLFRGTANLHAVYNGADNTPKSLDQELSFSQYTHLDNEHKADAGVWTYPIVTGLEMDFSAEQPMVKASLSVQYIIYDRKAMDITEDAYSTVRNSLPEKQTLQLLTKLDSMTENINLTQKFPNQAKQILDVACYPAHPEKLQNGEKLEVDQPVVFQILYSDMEGNLQGSAALGKQTWEFSSDPLNLVDIEVVKAASPRIIQSGDDVSVTADIQLQAVVCSENGLPMISGIEMKEPKELDPSRPSLIVRKLGSSRVWDIAKQYGAKVSDIKAVNNLDNDPASDQVLLIPIS